MTKSNDNANTVTGKMSLVDFMQLSKQAKLNYINQSKSFQPMLQKLIG
jgi:hypothetical protein